MGELKTVATYQSVQQADLMQSMLAEHGIQSFVNNATIVHMEWILSDAVGGVRVDCAEEDYERAKSIVDQLEFKRRQRRKNLKQIKVSFVCEECHREITVTADRCGFVENCPLCGQYVDVPELEDCDTTDPPTL